MSKHRRRGSKYRKVRKAAFERDNYICQSCGCKCAPAISQKIKNLKKSAEKKLEAMPWGFSLDMSPKYDNEITLDHIVPTSQGGAAYDIDNMQTLCNKCHVEKTRQENISNDHNNLVDISCTICREVFSNKNLFKEHMIKEHGIQVTRRGIEIYYKTGDTSNER